MRVPEVTFILIAGKGARQKIAAPVSYADEAHYYQHIWLETDNNFIKEVIRPGQLMARLKETISESIAK
jgi:hypothetical protein